MSGPRVGAHRQAEPAGDIVERVSADSPAERPGEGRMRIGDPAPKRALRGLGLVDDGDQLEIGLAERHDSVGRAPPGVTATLDRSEAVPRFDLARGACRSATASSTWSSSRFSSDIAGQYRR